MKLNRASVEILQSAFGRYADQAHVEWWKFGDDGKVIPSSHSWGRGWEVDGPGPDYAVYYSCGLLKPGQGRANANVVAVKTLVIDDVGTKLPKHDIDGLIEVGILPSPLGYVVESSAGNFQYGWYLSDGDVAAYAQLRKMMAEIYDMKDGMAPSHLFRLPIGVNGKPGPNAAFAVRRVAWKT